MKDWAELKPKTPNGYLPLLQVDGDVVLDQYKAIARFVCDTHGMYPEDADESYDVEQIVEICSEDCKAIKNIKEFFAVPNEEKNDYIKKALTEGLEGMLEIINRNCKKSLKENGWTATSSLSFSDVWLFTWMSKWCYHKARLDVTEPIVKKFKYLVNFYKKMLAHDGGVLGEYVKNRPDYLL